MLEICFHSLSLAFFYRFSSNSVYGLILKSSVPWRGMLHACIAFNLFVDFDWVCDILLVLLRACISDSFAFIVAFYFKVILQCYS